MPGLGRGDRTILERVLLAAAAVSLVAVLAGLAYYQHLKKGYDLKSLDLLRGRVRLTESEFGKALNGIRQRMERLRGLRLPDDQPELFALLAGEVRDPESEGIALYDDRGLLEAWQGRVLALRDILSAADFERLTSLDAPFIIRDKASVFLVLIDPERQSSRVNLRAFFKLMAFIPQFQSLYLREFHSLGKAAGSGFDADYWDFREDVSGFESFFSRTNDFYIGKPGRSPGTQTVFFPLRNEQGRILATVRLSSPALVERAGAIREYLALLLLAVWFLAGLAGLAVFWRRFACSGRKDAASGAGVILLVFVLRALLLPLPRLEKLWRLPFFSPGASGFVSVGTLTASPADILFTALLLLAVTAVLTPVIKEAVGRWAAGWSDFSRAAALAAAGTFTGAALALFRRLVRTTVFNSSVALDHWNLDSPALILHIGLFLMLIAFLAPSFASAGGLAGAQEKRTRDWLLFFLPGLAALCVAGGPGGVGALTAAAALLACFVLITLVPAASGRRELLVLSILFAALMVSRAVDNATAARARRVIDTTVRQAAGSQAVWAKFILEQTFNEIDRSELAVGAFFKNPAAPDFARTLWSRTSAARANWYSCLEVRDSAGGILSRFSLNIPKFYGSQPELETSETWSIARRSLAFIGQKREFLIGYRDFSDESHYLGRVMIYVALSPEMLPFAYSANPYFEALRPNPLPSLSQFDIGYAVFDQAGNAVFNPRHIAWRPGPEALLPFPPEKRISWTDFEDRGSRYSAAVFATDDSVHVVFIPRKKLRVVAAAFIRLAFLYVILAAGPALAVSLRRGRSGLRKPLYSFSSRVYASFLAVALVPLLLYSFFTRNLFDRLFTQRFIEDAAVQAGYGQSLMEAFLVIQGREVSPYLAPSEDLALWISSTMANDVNLYSNGVLLASSRAEFFASGLIPEVLDGQAYAGLVFGGRPFYTSRMRIGRYAYQSLTVPYRFGGSILFISLPFPFEKQELARATNEIVEFLLLLASLFILLVMALSRGIRSIIIVPVRKLLAGTQAVGLGNLEVEIEHDSRDEMMTLIEGFNAMVRNLKSREQELAEMSKKLAWAEMARKVAHEIKNPLTPIQLSAEHVLKVYEDRKSDFDGTLRESMSYIISEVDNLRRIAQEFMELARDTSLAREPVDLGATLADLLKPYQSALQDRIKFRLEQAGPDFKVMGDSGKLGTAFRNIIANAVEAVTRKGVIRVRLENRGSLISVAVTDSGCGMTAETAARVFEPYFSTKGSGTGLGLPIAKKIIEDHGGTIAVESEPGRGTTVMVELPVGS